MPSKTVDLHSISFKSKTEAIAYFKDMLHRYQDGDELTYDDGAILLELLQRHPDADDKIGVGVKHFYRDKALIYPTSCFHLERTDGIKTDFSYRDCISGNASTLAQQFSQACHYAVSEKLISKKEQLFKEAGGTLKCKKTGAQITINEAEYRHTSPSFQEIVKNFIAENNITITPDLVTRSVDMQYVTSLVDSNIESLFKIYHASKANLEMFKKYER
jgi:hypothetical protein